MALTEGLIEVAGMSSQWVRLASGALAHTMRSADAAGVSERRPENPALIAQV